MCKFSFNVKDECEGQRLDKWLSEQNELNLTRSMLQRLISDNEVLVNGIAKNKNYILKANDIITLSVPVPKKLDVKAENLPIDIIYQDNDLLVVNKPKGMVVHPAAGNYDGTLVNALMYHCDGHLSSINGVIRPGIVHRIDKDTSGLLIVAKNDAAHLGLAQQIKAHSFTREYEAVACGILKEEHGTVNAPVGRHPADRKKMYVTEKNSKEAITHYEVLKIYANKYSHLRLNLETGRTHQIRVHMSYIGHPLLGDYVYGKSFTGIEGQCLHAKKIGFIHPITNKYLEFDSNLPDYFLNIIKKIDK